MAETVPTIPDQRLASSAGSGSGSGPGPSPGPGSAASTLALPSAHMSASQAMGSSSSSSPPLPRVTIRFCTQCKWMLRAAYFAQELLSTFSTSLGEVALQPTTGGIFIVEIYYSEPEPKPESAFNTDTDTTVSEHSTPRTTTEPNAGPTTQHRLLWDRKIDGGFPETKELKRRVRDVIEPGRNLGHVDRDYPRHQQQPESKAAAAEAAHSTLEGDNMPETKEQQQERQQQRQGQQGQQPPGPRWPQLNNNDNKSSSSQPTTQERQTVATADLQPKPSTGTNTSTGPQGKVPKDLGPYPRQDTTSTDASGGPVYNPRMPGGGIMPVVPPVAPSSRIQEALASQAESQSHKNQNQNECEDCQ